MQQIRASLWLLILFTLVTGLAYPLLTTSLAQWLWSENANGSLIYRQQNMVGSRLIGQDFQSEAYFHSRPSATADTPYNALASSGSNLAASNPALAQAISGRAAAWHATVGSQRPIPTDLLTASGSGLDPHITPEAAHYQAVHIAQRRNIPLPEVEDLIARYTETPMPAFIGRPVVNVLQLNLALDTQQPVRAYAQP